MLKAFGSATGVPALVDKSDEGSSCSDSHLMLRQQAEQVLRLDVGRYAVRKLLNTGARC